MNEDDVVAVVFGNTDDSSMAVDHVFKALAATYTTAWERELGAAPITDIKTAWAYQLGQFTHSKNAKRAILWALRNLPNTAPSAIQFRNLCRLAPAAPDLLRLPEPAAGAARVAAELAKLAPVRQTVASSGPVDHKAWARRIIAKHAEGMHVNVGPLRYACEALGLPTDRARA